MKIVPRNLLVVCFLSAVLVFLLHYLVVGQAVYGDGRFYYSFVHSLYFDLDLDVQNQLVPRWQEVFSGQPNQSVGTGLAWLPAIALADIGSRVANTIFKLTLPLDGYGDNYQIITGIYAIGLAILGLLLTYKITRHYFDQSTSVLAITTLWLTTNLFFYTSIDVLNTHPTSFFLSSLIIYQLVKLKTKPAFIQIFFLGWLLGLAFCIREQDIATFIPLFLYFFYQKRLLFNYKIIIIVLIGFLIGIFPQVYYWQTYFDALLPRLGHNQWLWQPEKIPAIILGSKRGILFYSPSIFLALYGLLAQKAKIAKLALVIFFCQLFLIANWWAWHQGESYGIRMLISVYPLLCLGYAYVVKKVKPKRFLLLLVFLTLLNFLMIFRFLILETSDTENGINPATQQRIEKLWYNLLGNIGV